MQEIPAMQANDDRKRENDVKLGSDIRQLSLFILCAMLLATSSLGQENKIPSSAEQEIISLARARANALANNECDRWASYVADDFQDIEAAGIESHDDEMKACRSDAASAAPCKSERILSDFHFRFAESFAFVHYQYLITRRCGDITWPDPHRQVDTYEKRNGKWIALYVAEVGQPQDPPVAKIDPAILDDYTGQYAWEGAVSAP